MDKREPSAVDPAAVVNRLACRSFLTLIGDSRDRQAPESTDVVPLGVVR